MRLFHAPLLGGCPSDRWATRIALAWALALGSSADAQRRDARVTLLISDPQGLASGLQAPVSVELELSERLRKAGMEGMLRLLPWEDDRAPIQEEDAIPAQFHPDPGDARRGTLLWMMTPGLTGEHRLLLGWREEPLEQRIAVAGRPEDPEGVEFLEGDMPILRYNYVATRPPAGIDPGLARGDYISALYGPVGEIITADYPLDHPHHRGVNWSWATLNWQGESRDLFAVQGVWSRPGGRGAWVTAGPVAGIIDEESQWMWDDRTPVVHERVVIRAYRQIGEGRIVDVIVHLTSMVEGLEFCGRLPQGYSGFNARMASGQGQAILLHNDPAGSKPRRSWADYSAVFPGGIGRSGLAILQHELNPAYPSEWIQYPDLNFFQPAYPGGALIPMSVGQTLTLQYRMWIHRGAPDEKVLADLWTVFSRPPSVILAR